MSYQRLSAVPRFLDTPQVACYKPTAFQSGRPRLILMPSAYIPIVMFVVIATGFAVFTLVFTSLIHPSKYNKVKLEPYECGIEPATDARDRYSIRYYLVAMLFVIFDVETVFMFPWAVRSEERRVGKECRSRWSTYQ